MSESDEAGRRRQESWGHLQERLPKKGCEDDNPVVLTAYQAAKCAAILSAALGRPCLDGLGPGISRGIGRRGQGRTHSTDRS